MNKIKKISKKILVFMLLLSMFLGIGNGLQLHSTTVKAADHVANIIVTDLTTGKSDYINVRINSDMIPNMYKYNISKVSGSSTNFGLELNGTTATAGYSSDHVPYVVNIPLKLTKIPAHTEFVERLHNLGVNPVARLNFFDSFTSNHSTKTSTYQNVTRDTLKTHTLAVGQTTEKTFYASINKRYLGYDHSGSQACSGISMTMNIQSESYKINYNMNGATLNKAYGLSYPVNPTENVVGNLAVGTASKTGYTFTGWNATNLDSHFNQFAQVNPENIWINNNTTSFTMAKENFLRGTYFVMSCLNHGKGTVTLTPIFRENKYTVKLDGNGFTTSDGKSRIDLTKDTFRYVSDKVTMPEDTGVFIKGQAYKLAGWSTDSNAIPGDSDVYAPGTTANRLTPTDGGTAILYAVWEKDPTMLAQPNALLNTQKHMEVLITKIAEGLPYSRYDARFAVYPWSAKNGKFSGTAVKIINSNKRYELEYTADNQGKFKIKEIWVEEPLVMSGAELIFSLDNENCVNIPFYENRYIKEDKGFYVPGRGYEINEIVRNTKEVTPSTIFYKALRAVPGRNNSGNNITLTDTHYWRPIASYEGSILKNLRAGAGEWDDSSYSYARAFSAEVANEKPENGSLSFSLQKYDPSGNPLSGAEFNAYYTDGSNALCSAMRESVNKGEYGINMDANGQRDRNLNIPIDDKWTDVSENGAMVKKIKLLIKEDKAPIGFHKINDFYVTSTAVKSSAGGWDVSEVVASSLDGKVLQTIGNQKKFEFEGLTDEPFKVDITLHKQGEKGLYSTSLLSGATYVIYEDEALTKPVTEVTINSNGTASATNLPVKDYWIQERKTPASGYFLYSDKVYHVSADDILNHAGNVNFENSNAKEYIEVYEPEVTGFVKVHKEDIEGNEVNGAKFSLFKWNASMDENNLDGYTWNVNNAVSTQTVVNGYANFSNIPIGKYVLVETTVPDGWEKAPSQIIEVTFDNTTEDTAAITSVIETREKVRLKIYKEDSADNKEKLEGAVFKIYNVTDKTYIFQNGLSIDNSGNVIPSKDEKLFTTNKKGEIVTDDNELEFNKTYRIEEIKAPQGYLLDANSQTITFTKGKQEGKDSDGVPYFAVTFKDNKTEFSFEKRDIMTSEEIPGGHYAITKDHEYIEPEDGAVSDINDVVDEWDGNGKPHKVYGLIAGETYFFNELIAPDGYTITQSIEFTVNDDGKSVIINGENSNIVTMYDDFNKVELLKTNAKTKAPLPGAKMELYKGNKAEGSPLYSWTSTDKAYRIDRLPAGEYTWVEVSAPKGYIIGKPIIIDVADDTEVQTFEFENDFTKTQFEKISSVTGEPLEGCVLQILDENKNIVYSPDGEKLEWVTDGSPHEVDYLESGKTYYLHEVSAPSNYYLADDVKFTAGEPWVNEDAYTHEKDEFVYPRDESQLPPDLDDPSETETNPAVTPDGEDSDEDYQVDDENNEENDYDTSAADTVKIYMMNNPKLVSIVKKNSEKDFLNGAKLQLLDKNKQVIDTWISDFAVAKVFNLSNGKYYIHEVYAPDVWDLTEDVEFEVTDNTKMVEYEMVDDYIKGTLKITKTDEVTKKPLKDIEYTLVGELVNGKKITLKAKTDENGEITFGCDKESGKGTLIPGKYTITETKAEGHTLLKDPIEVTLPLDMSDAEVNAQDVDIAKGKWDEEKEMYRFFDLSYDVSNDAVLRMPTTGSNSLLYAVIAGGIVFLLTIAYLGIKRRKSKTEQ